MSNYSVRVHDPKATPADGNRFSVLNYRQTEEEKKAKKAKKAAKCVEIPALDVDTELAFMHNAIDVAAAAVEEAPDEAAKILAKVEYDKVMATMTSTMRAFTTAAQEWQDDIIRSLVDDGGSTEISPDRVTFAAAITFANAESVKKRTSKESIGTWYENDLMPGIITKLSEPSRNLLPEKIAEIVADYAAMYEKLASVAPKVGKVNAQQLLKLVNEIAPASIMKTEIARKLELILAPPEVTLVNI